MPDNQPVDQHPGTPDAEQVRSMTTEQFVAALRRAQRDGTATPGGAPDVSTDLLPPGSARVVFDPLSTLMNDSWPATGGGGPA